MEQRKIIFFDGECNLCNSFISYVINRDSNKSLYFCTLQSNLAKTLLNEYDSIILETNFSTIYYYSNNKLYSKSSAILHIFLELSILHKIIAKIALIIPKLIRDFIYTLISKNRYRLFGKKETCRLPTEDEKKQFI